MHCGGADELAQGADLAMSSIYLGRMDNMGHLAALEITSHVVGLAHQLPTHSI